MSWFRFSTRRKKSKSQTKIDNNNNNNKLSEVPFRSHSLQRPRGYNRPNNNIRGQVADEATMLRYFNLRQPTNLTGRFPSTVALHAKVEEGAGQQPGGHALNLVQPLSLRPDWR